MGIILFIVLLLCFSILFYFLFTDKGEERINLVILGQSGPGHAGETLTDTMIFSSISTHGTTLISIPRDLWYQPWQTKVNTLYYYGEERRGGLVETKEVLGEILGQRIDYALVIDFKVFEEMVDLVGGVDVEVEQSFDDNFYPLPGLEEDLCDGDPKFACRYESLHFEQGQQHFGGDEALKFVRSRYAEGDEGTDAARSKRQQKVILALKNKITSPKIFLSPTKISGLFEIFEERVKSDIPQEKVFDLVKIFVKPQARQFDSFVLNGEREGPFDNPKRHPSGQWVLIPKDPTWQETHQLIDCFLLQQNKFGCSLGKKQPGQESQTSPR